MLCTKLYKKVITTKYSEEQTAVWTTKNIDAQRDADLVEHFRANSFPSDSEIIINERDGIKKIT